MDKGRAQPGVARGVAGTRAKRDAAADNAVSAGFSFMLQPVETGLQHLITSLFHFASEEIRIDDVQPASVGMVLVFLRGSGSMVLAGRQCPIPRVAIIGPTSMAVPFSTAGPVEFIGAALSPLGWAALTGLDAKACADCVTVPEPALGKVLDDVLARHGATDHGRAVADNADVACADLAETLARFARPVPARHAALLDQVRNWMGSSFDPPMADLLAMASYSERQLQRVCERYYGCSPKQLSRKYRALRVAALLQDAAADDDLVAQVTDLFYDQAHMIREIRHFTGQTPARLGNPGQPVRVRLTSAENFRSHRNNIAPLPES